MRTLDDLGNVVVAQRNSMPILVRDLGSLNYTHQEPEGILGKNENPASLEGIVMGLKYTNVSDVSIGKSIRLVINADSEAAARAQIEEMCERLLANPVIEGYAIEVRELAGK